MWVRLSAFVIWALVAGTLVFWGLRLFTRAPSAPAHTVSVASGLVARGDLTRLFGAPNETTAAAVLANPEISARFRLLGVMAPKGGTTAKDSGQGIALIAVDGKPPRAFAIGAALDADLVLQSVNLRSASIGPALGEAAVKLEIPPLPAPATGTLPAADAGTALAVPPPPVNRVAAPPSQVPPPVPQPAVVPSPPQVPQ
ncbi:MAG: hypothetical protein OEY03_10730, partial [Rhizobacter sp.]|nr:hypothetical protein [Rhizobacter sp.]